MTFLTLPERAVDMATHPTDNSIWIINQHNSRIQRWDTEFSQFVTVSNQPRQTPMRITFDESGQAIVVTDENEIFRLEGTQWERIDSPPALDVQGVWDMMGLLMTNTKGTLQKMIFSEGIWKSISNMSPPANRVASFSTERFWYLSQDNTLFEYAGKSVEQSIPFTSRDVAMEPQRPFRPFVLTKTGQVFVRDHSSRDWVFLAESIGADRLEIRSNGDLVFMDTIGRISIGSASTQAHMENIPDEFAEVIRAHLSKGIRLVAFHPNKRGIALVTDDNNVFYNGGVPREFSEKIDELIRDGHEVRCIAFPPLGGNSWSIITDKTFFNRNIPNGANEAMEVFDNNNKTLQWIAFPHTGGPRYAVLCKSGQDNYVLDGVNDSVIQMTHNMYMGVRDISNMTFDRTQNAVIIAEDYCHNYQLGDDDLKRAINETIRMGRQIQQVAMLPDVTGWVILTNRPNERMLTTDPVRDFEMVYDAETFTSRYSIWNRMNDRKLIGLSVAAVRNNRIDWETTYGYRRIDTRDILQHDTIFQVASVSKPLVAVAILKLVEEGAFDLDDDITNLISGWIPHLVSDQMPDEWIKQNTNLTTCIRLADGGCTSTITPRRLLSHCAGTSVHGFPNFEEGPFPTTLEVINGESPARNSKVQIIYQPYTNGDYSGGGYMLLQHLIETVKAPTSFADWMQTNILKPLGMHSSFFHRTPPANLKNRVLAAGHDNGVVLHGERRHESALAAGGLYSTAGDLARFIIMINQQGMTVDGKRFLSESSIGTLLQLQHNFTVLGSDGYGLGVDLADIGSLRGRFRFMHGGSEKGFRAYIAGFPDRNLGIVVLSNRPGKPGSDYKGTTRDQDDVIDIYRKIRQIYLGW